MTFLGILYSTYLLYYSKYSNKLFLNKNIHFKIINKENILNHMAFY